ncbi:MAG: hypothetical protein IK078_03390 [Lachnospiraceae bacterium]|nr:hypothetical protein [Lachnospiraceae bacterium]
MGDIIDDEVHVHHGVTALIDDNGQKNVMRIRWHSIMAMAFTIVSSVSFFVQYYLFVNEDSEIIMPLQIIVILWLSAFISSLIGMIKEKSIVAKVCMGVNVLVFLQIAKFILLFGVLLFLFPPGFY